MRWLKYIILLFVSFWWFAGCSPSLGKWLYEHHIIKDDYRYGDLYRMANLPQFRVLKEKCIYSPVKKEKLQLIIAGDSFTEEGRIDQEMLAADQFDRIRVDEKTFVKLENQLPQVLVIETVERHARERFSSKWRGIILEEPMTASADKVWYKKLLELRMPYNAELHESELFGFDFSMTIREWKALLNYKLFNRVDPGVALNKSEEHLLYGIPTKPGINSAFDPITDEEIDSLVFFINEAVDYYQKAGIEHVVLNIIPNKTSILGADLGNYNQLVQRIYQHPDLKAETFNIYPAFKEMHAGAYEIGDTHWSCTGQQLWIDRLNQLLKESIDAAKVSAELAVATSD